MFTQVLGQNLLLPFLRPLQLITALQLEAGGQSCGTANKSQHKEMQGLYISNKAALDLPNSTIPRDCAFAPGPHHARHPTCSEHRYLSPRKVVTLIDAVSRPSLLLRDSGPFDARGNGALWHGATHAVCCPAAGKVDSDCGAFSANRDAVEDLMRMITRLDLG